MFGFSLSGEVIAVYVNWSIKHDLKVKKEKSTTSNRSIIKKKFYLIKYFVHQIVSNLLKKKYVHSCDSSLFKVSVRNK